MTNKQYIRRCKRNKRKLDKLLTDIVSDTLKYKQDETNVCIIESANHISTNLVFFGSWLKDMLTNRKPSENNSFTRRVGKVMEDKKKI